jgi:hypothetical protein
VDTKALAVGQDVHMVSGWYMQKGKVVKVTSSGVEVQLDKGSYLIRFDTNGKACDSSDIYRGNMEWNGIPGTFECGPWELADIPLEERAAFEKNLQEKHQL